MSFILKIGSRPSALALAQTALVKGRLAELLPELKIDICPISTSGDRMTSASLAQLGGKGLFIRELEQALSERRIDLAVHSMKDLPASLAPQFQIAATPPRENSRDALLSRGGESFPALPRGARLGTSSSRRKFEALRLRPDLQIVPLRGNVDTRLRRLQNGDFEAIVLAIAGLKRLGRYDDAPPIELDETEFVPCAGQGALALETTADQPARGAREVCAAIASLNDPATAAEVTAERAFLAGIGASCASPVGVKGAATENRLRVRALLFSLDGKRWLEDAVEGAVVDAARLGNQLAERMIAAGAGALIADG